jgi:molybdopterin-guanine dinucleotide biosynthesis protein A
MPERKAIGGVILCGGRGARMGMPKAMLPFGPESMLERVARLAAQAASPVVIVTAANVAAPPNWDERFVARDERANCGPLEGLRAGLARIEAHAPAAYVASCDAPLLAPAVIRWLAELLDNNEAVVPVEGDRLHALAAIYRSSIHRRIAPMLDAGERRLSALVECLDARRVDVADLRALDPDLDTFRNVNHPHEYLAALEKAGLSPQPDVVAELRR